MENGRRELITVEECATYTRLSRFTIYTFVCKRRIPFIKLGRRTLFDRAEIDRYVGYYEDYASSHLALDADRAFQEETRNAARALVQAVKLLRRGGLIEPDAKLKDPRPK